MKDDGFVKLICSQPLINERYKSIELRSDKGYFSYLFKGYDVKEEIDVALKYFDPSHNHEVYRLECFQREIDLLNVLKGNDNILQILDGPLTHEIKLVDSLSGVEHLVQHKFFVTELASSDIEEYIYTNTDDAIKKLVTFRELCKAVFRLHRKGICHRDLKPDNFLIFNNGDIKVSDFGTAVMIDSKPFGSYIAPVGHKRYAAPELFFEIGIRDRHSYGADYYSLGAILFEMFTLSELWGKIFDFQFRTNLSRLHTHLMLVEESKRKYVFDETIDTVVSAHRLPDIFSYNDLVPKCIKQILNKLFKEMCQLNYLKRNVDQQSILRQIDICILTLKNDKVDRLRKKQKRFLREKKKC